VERSVADSTADTLVHPVSATVTEKVVLSSLMAGQPRQWGNAVHAAVKLLCHARMVELTKVFSALGEFSVVTLVKGPMDR
jgi:hypothetical protein